MKHIGYTILWIVVGFSFSILFIRLTPWFSGMNAEALITKYSKDEIEHFSSFAFQDGKLRKWRNDIVIGEFDDKVKKSVLNSQIIECVELLNGLVEEISIRFSGSTNLTIGILDSIVDNSLGQAPTKISSFKIPYPSIKSGRIQVYLKNRQNEEIFATLVHEFSHILGFNHNYLVEYQSDFNHKPTSLINTEEGEKFVNSFHGFSDLDRSSIRIMYDQEVAIDPGMTKAKFYKLIEDTR